MVAVHRGAFVGIAIVAVLALSFTAAAVDTGLNTVNHEIAADDTDGTPPDEQPSGGQEKRDGEGSHENSGTVGAAEDSTEGQPERTDGPAPWQVVASVCLLTVGGVVIVYGLTRGENVDIESDRSETESTHRREDTDRLTFAADVPPTNDVYRVWLALHREIRPESPAVSPAELATTAVERGYDERAVETLTREFCAVRYGHASPTDERERRARTLGETLDISVEAEMDGGHIAGDD